MKPLATKATKFAPQRTVHVPASTMRPGVCPVCGCVEHECVSRESRRRDVSRDTWRLTLLGQALLDGLRALEGRQPDA